MATIDLITYDQKMVTPKDDALIHQFGISNGVLYGCEVTLANSNTLHITGGQGVIYGRQWEIAEGDITVTLPASGSLKGRLYVKIDLSNTTNPIELLVQTAVTLPDLTDDDQINVDNSVSELELCTFDVSSLTISNLVRTVEQVADGDHQDVVDLQADVSEIKSNLTDLGNITKLAEVDFATNSESSDISLSEAYNNYEFVMIEFKVADEYNGSLFLRTDFVPQIGSVSNNSNIVNIWHSSNYHASLRVQFKSATTFRHFITESVGWVSGTNKRVTILGINKKPT